MGRRRPPRDGRFRRHARDTPRDVRRARKNTPSRCSPPPRRRGVAAAAADSEAVDPAPLVRFALLREDLTARESATDGERTAGRGVAFAADADARTGSGDSKTEFEKLATNARDDRKSSLVSLLERDAALRALVAVRDEHAAEVTRLCASQENYEAFIAAVARLGGVRDLLRRTASCARAARRAVAAGARARGRG